MSRRRVLTDEQAREVVRLRDQRMPQAQIAQAVGITASMVTRIATGRAYSEVTGIEQAGPAGRPRTLTAEQAQDILAAARRGTPRLTIARAFAINRSTVDRIVKGIAYADCTGIDTCVIAAKNSVAARNLKRAGSFRGPVECVKCQAKVRRTARAVQKSAGITYCPTCWPERGGAR